MGMRRQLGSGGVAAVSIVLASAALACSDAHGNQPAQVMDASTVRDAGSTAAPRVKPRTVSIELFPTAERVLEPGPGGGFVYGPLVDIGGVEVCVAHARPAFASFDPFVNLAEPLCTTSVEGESVQIEGVPANRDLVLTFRKPGYAPGTFTFRTDDFDVAAPMWGGSQRTTLVREGAVEPWMEPAPPPQTGDGLAVIFVAAVWTGATPVVPDSEMLVAGILVNVAPGEGVAVEIEDANGGRIAEVTTLREHPNIVSLPEGSYRMRFSHPRMNEGPVGRGNQYMVTGLPLDSQDTVEVPIVSGSLGFAVVDGECAAPSWTDTVEDLSTCTLAAPDASAP
jgi:hypothetical protein